jgi:2-iminobutanoate/2-iminopropanoate deaminase
MLIHHTDPKMPHSHLPFSPAVQVGNLLFVSGQASVDHEGRIVDDDFEGEMRRAVGNLAAILDHCGSGLDLVVKTQNYLADPKYRDLYNQLYPMLFPRPFPARTTVTKGLSGTLKYEIDCIAVVRDHAGAA